MSRYKIRTDYAGSLPHYIQEAGTITADRVWPSERAALDFLARVLVRFTVEGDTDVRREGGLSVESETLPVTSTNNIRFSPSTGILEIREASWWLVELTH